MTNAAVYIHTQAYDTSDPNLVGRLSAGESFLRGFIRNAEVDRFHFYNFMSRPASEMDALVRRIEPPQKPVRWVNHLGRPELADPGVLYLPVPDLGSEAFERRPHGSRTYAICGVTHTTATALAMRVICNLLLAPVEGYDALICTSDPLRASVETQLDMMREYLTAEFGPRRRPEPMRVTIPLGINASDFSTSGEHRRAWRERLNIPDDAIVALYVGRFNVRGKMNPGLMAMALERAARRTGKPIYWVNSGWATTESEGESYHTETRKACPSVEYREVDGRQPDVRFSIWSVADLFISFSDNIQETFGLTPIEAMAAGLPSVVSDWDGYRDTVRDGVDGFRIPTLGPRPGLGEDIAYSFENCWMNYNNYIGATGQYTAVDLDAAERSLCALIYSADLRARLGEAARRRAREVFDWAAIIPQYQALWAEQNAMRQAASPDPCRTRNPMYPDPYRLFAEYPTRHLQGEDVVRLQEGMDPQQANTWLARPLAQYSRFNRPTPSEVDATLRLLVDNGPTKVNQILAAFPLARRDILERGLIWLARHDVVAIDG